MAESEEELKSLLMKVKEESEKTGLNSTSFKKLKTVTSDPTTSWHIDGGNVETVSDFIRQIDAEAEAPILWLLDEKS